MTHQHDTLAVLELAYAHVSVRDAGDGTESVFADCFDRDPLCDCGREPEAPRSARACCRPEGTAPTVSGWLLPVATFRVSPSGFCQRIDREGVGV
jgi:hypothetical protein